MSYPTSFATFMLFFAGQSTDLDELTQTFAGMLDDKQDYQELQDAHHQTFQELPIFSGFFADGKSAIQRRFSELSDQSHQTISTAAELSPLQEINPLFQIDTRRHVTPARPLTARLLSTSFSFQDFGSVLRNRQRTAGLDAYHNNSVNSVSAFTPVALPRFLMMESPESLKQRLHIKEISPHDNGSLVMVKMLVFVLFMIVAAVGFNGLADFTY